MKKVLLGALLLLSINVFSQEDKGPFVRKYTSYLVTTNNVEGELKQGNTTVVYNEDDTTNISIYLGDDKILLYSTGKIETGKTNSGQEYQLVKCINSRNGKTVSLQLFEMALRIFTNEEFTDSIQYFR
jgi:hypothetical protein